VLIVTAKAPGRRFALLAALILLAAVSAVLLFRSRLAPGERDDPSLRAETNEERVAYLEALGWQVRPEPIEAIRVTLPEELTEPYRSYNELQLRQGFDLTPCCGETLDRYTYALTNYPGRSGGCQADLYVYRGEVVAGDVVCTGENGFIDTLDFPSGS